MNVQDALISRRSIRVFRKEHPGRARIEDLIEMAITAPSASNKQPWRFFIADNPETIKKMATLVTKAIDEILVHIESPYLAAFQSYGDYFVRFLNAPVVIAAAFKEIAVLSNLVNGSLPPVSSEQIRKMERDSGLISTSLAIQNLMLYAHAQGLGSSCMTGPLVAAGKLKQLLTIPEGWDLAAIIAIGYADETPVAQARKPAQTVIRWVDDE